MTSSKQKASSVDEAPQSLRALDNWQVSHNTLIFYIQNKDFYATKPVNPKYHIELFHGGIMPPGKFLHLRDYFTNEESLQNFGGSFICLTC